MDSIIQRAVHQISSWISAEVAFARQGLEKDVHDAITQSKEDKVRRDADLQDSRSQLTSKLELLQTDLREVALAVGKLQKSDRSPAVDEKRLQHKVSSIEATVGEHAKSMESLSQHMQYFNMTLHGSRKDIDRHASELMRLAERTGDARADMQTGEARADLMAWELRRTHAALSEELGKKASSAQMNETCTTLRTWIEEARTAHQTSVDNLSKLLEQCRASNVAHSVMLNRHEEWMKELSCLL